MGSTWAKADIKVAQVTETEYIPERFIVTFHQGMMPPYDTYEFDKIQDLANFMREQADLRTWKQLYDENGDPRI